MEPLIEVITVQGYVGLTSNHRVATGYDQVGSHYGRGDFFARHAARFAPHKRALFQNPRPGRFSYGENAFSAEFRGGFWPFF